MIQFDINWVELNQWHPFFFVPAVFFGEISVVFFRLQRNFKEFHGFLTPEKGRKKKNDTLIANPKKKALISGGGS